MRLCDSKEPDCSGPGSPCSRFYIRSYLKILKIKEQYDPTLSLPGSPQAQ